MMICASGNAGLQFLANRLVTGESPGIAFAIAIEPGGIETGNEIE